MKFLLSAFTKVPNCNLCPLLLLSIEFFKPKISVPFLTWFLLASLSLSLSSLVFLSLHSPLLSYILPLWSSIARNIFFPLLTCLNNQHPIFSLVILSFLSCLFLQFLGLIITLLEIVTGNTLQLMLSVNDNFEWQ